MFFYGFACGFFFALLAVAALFALSFWHFMRLDIMAETADSPDWVHLDVEEVVEIRARAICLKVNRELYWFPKSQVADVEAYKEGEQDCTVSVKRFIAQEKGLA